MTDTPSGPQPANSAMAVLAAIADLGAATPAAIATKVGIGYSTVNPKLRAWEDAGLAERFRKDGQTQWRLTDAGKASTATPQQHPAAPPPEATPPVDAADDGTDLKPVAGSDNAVPPTSWTSPADPDADGGGDGAITQMPTPARRAAESGAAAPPPAPTTMGTADDTDADSDPATNDPTAQDETPPTDVGPCTDDDSGGAAAPSSAADPAGRDDALTEPEHTTDQTPPAEDPRADPGAPPVPAVATKRPKGGLEASVLAVLRAHPDRTYKVNDLRKLVDQADKDTGYPKASAGAVANVLDKLGRNGHVITVPAKYVTVQAAPATD